jgi:hypothetical protein
MHLLDWLLPFGQKTEEEGRYTALRAEAILKTICTLEHRIEERFPDSGLLAVCREFYQLAVRSDVLAKRLEKPIWLVRLAALVASFLLVGLALWAIAQLVEQFQFDSGAVLDVLQTTESAINELIFLGLAVYTLISLEARLKRRTVQEMLHRLRSIAHIVDMHQLTKDPAFMLSQNSAPATESSPAGGLTKYQLARYLDYCSEMLSLNAKVAALFAQHTDDTEVVSAVKDLEDLTQGLSAKIWQKIMILDLSAE